jgi:hypothetical protein
MILFSEIVQRAPKVKGKKLAIYSVNCGWWTADPSDAPQKCCPHCAGMLSAMPLEDFIAKAEKDKDRYGRFGLTTLLSAYAMNSSRCYPTWEQYERDVKNKKEYEDAKYSFERRLP